ncbi:hypothetical protein B0T16DRAFT_453117 [Cercophora newfieldiana]|uniref:Uncharacterized protein n=1 Tax=Cercophora newfieldiana TaxID=92897 RepID=A0AA40D0W5_9PEZI|nr:hypothetical protein B0T16DRAFT_453117 [Cercophora newfieldiana]
MPAASTPPDLVKVPFGPLGGIVGHAAIGVGTGAAVTVAVVAAATGTGTAATADRASERAPRAAQAARIVVFHFHNNTLDIIRDRQRPAARLVRVDAQNSAQEPVIDGDKKPQVLSAGRDSRVPEGREAEPNFGLLARPTS